MYGQRGYGHQPQPQVSSQYGQQLRGYSPHQHQQQHGYPPQQQQLQGYPPQQQQPHGHPLQQQQLHGYPPQRQQPPGYAPQQQQQQGYPPQQSGYPPQPMQQQHGYPPTQQAYPPNGAPPPGGAMPPRAGPAPPTRAAIPSVGSAYASQAARWKSGFKSAADATNGGASSRPSDLEAPLIKELCASAGSSHPPRESLQRLLRHLPSLDHEYLCELLDDKLDDRVWQVQGKALSVLDALCKSPDGAFFIAYYYRRQDTLVSLCQSRKELLRPRAEKLYKLIKSNPPPAREMPEPTANPQSAPTDQAPPPELLSMSPSAPPLSPSQTSIGAAPVSPMAGSSSAFGFLNSEPSSSPTPATPQSEVPTSIAPPVPTASAFSFISSASAAPPAPTPVAAAPALSASAPTPTPAPVPTAQPPPHDIFASLPAPTPIIGGMVLEDLSTSSSQAQTTAPSSDTIHDAFEGLNFDDDQDDVFAGADQGTTMAGNGTSVDGDGHTTVSSGMIPMDAQDPIREVFLEVDVPAGPMGLLLDRSITEMAVVAGFIPLPHTGQRGYLEMHPALSPGARLISINGSSVEDLDLDGVGEMLGSLIGTNKVMCFKRLMRCGRTVSPADPNIPYAAPRDEPTPPPSTDRNDDAAPTTKNASEEQMDEFSTRLHELGDRLTDSARRLEELVARDQAHLPIVDMKNQLAQLHGDIDKIQTQGIDAVILGPNPPPNADAVRQLRSSLVRRADALTRRIQRIAAEGTAGLSPLSTAAAGPGSPAGSGFSFVTSQPAQSQPPALCLADLSVTPKATGSAFSFLQGSTSSATSSLATTSVVDGGGASSGFSFMQNPSPPTPAVAPGAVFAGLSVRGDASAASTGPNPLGNASAFGFLNTGDSASSQSTPSPPPAMVTATAPPPGSAFSFISG